METHILTSRAQEKYHVTCVKTIHSENRRFLGKSKQMFFHELEESEQCFCSLSKSACLQEQKLILQVICLEHIS